jgi:hypothetical protein
VTVKAKFPAIFLRRYPSVNHILENGKRKMLEKIDTPFAEKHRILHNHPLLACVTFSNVLSY